MDIRDQIRDAISDLPDTEQMIMLSIMIDTLIEKADEIRQDMRIIRNVPISKIDPFEGHPFYVTDDENMMDLVKSIRTHGMLTPGAVRIKENGRYELLSGHRRLRACQLAGLKSFSCEILSLNDEEAILFMLEANRQRIRLRPGEKGLAYKMKDETLTGSILERDERAIRLDAADSMQTIHKLEHLDYLIPELMELVDKGVISLRPAYELSFLPMKFQKVLLDYIEYDQCTPSHSQAARMRRLNEEGALTTKVIEKMMGELKPNQRDKLVLREDTLAQIPADIPEYKREEYVAKALKLIRKVGRQ